MRDVDISLVTYQPDFDLLSKLIASVAEQTAGRSVGFLICDNSPDPGTAVRIAQSPALQPGGAFAHVDVQRAETNVGFGRGHNANAALSAAPLLFVVNQDAVLEPDTLSPLVAAAAADEPSVAAWELRQIPYEHPKAYDPVTLDVPWVSGAATLFRRAAFDDVGGFDPRIFMYGEDVDLSWRLRARGHRLRYLPRFGVVHRTYAKPGEIKALQVLGGVQTNLCLRARFGGLARTAQGLLMLAAEILAPQDFPGRRSGLVKAGARFFLHWPHFVHTRVLPTPGFAPIFSGWGYEIRRDGAFVEFRSRREVPRSDTPLVSILIRTLGRTEWLKEALLSVANQTWPNIEAVVIEDGPPKSQAVIDGFRGILDVSYAATGEKAGRARAGNLALASARGEWLNFLDDDDLLFADHVEALIDAARRTGAKGAYGLAWETHTKIHDRERAVYEEVARVTRHRQPFDRLTLWHHNYLPIQVVLFHRSLYERHGGFAEDMHQLEDWNLWTRYTLEDDFVLVEKTTSLYRVPANPEEAAGRQARLDGAYQDAVRRQCAMRLTLSPHEISRMVDSYVRSQSLLMVSRSDMRHFVGARPWLTRLAAQRGPVLRRLRGRRIAR
jgi:GT2 family glycosyltransferase